MLILGIETSCDETAASLIEIKNNRARVLSNVISSQVKLHAKFGGVVPSLAAREHIKNLPKVLKLALKPVAYNLKPVDLIAVTIGPGLISSLLVGTTFAKTLAWKYKKPNIGVNHLGGHIVSNWLKPVGEISNLQFPISNENQKLETRNQKLTTNLFPALCLIVSGGHTELVLMQNFGKYKIVGQTLDDAAGEAFDKIARILGLGYPGGPTIQKAASNWHLAHGQKPVASGQWPVLPRPMIKSEDFNFSFAGLKTAVLYLTRDLLKDKKIKKLNDQARTEIAAEAQQAIVDVLVAKTIRAAEKYKVKSIMLSGGVSANKLLRSNLNKAAEQMGLKFFKPEMEYTTDNAAMIALSGYFNYKTGKEKTPNTSSGRSVGRIDWKLVGVDANLGF